MVGWVGWLAVHLHFFLLLPRRKASIRGGRGMGGGGEKGGGVEARKAFCFPLPVVVTQGFPTLGTTTTGGTPSTTTGGSTTNMVKSVFIS